MDEQTAELIEQLRQRIAELEQENRRLREQLEEYQKLSMRQAAPFRREERLKIPPEQQNAQVAKTDISVTIGRHPTILTRRLKYLLSIALIAVVR
jgi:DNA repair exonuclease SbcCD ATPase subunit